MRRYYDQADELASTPTLAKIFELSFRKPDNIFALWPEDGQIKSLTYGAAKEKVAAAAAAFVDLALPPPACVGLKLKNCPEWGIIFWAVLAAGHRPVLLDAAADAAYDSQVIKKSGAVLLIADSDPAAVIPWISPKTLFAHAAAEHAGEWADQVMFCSSGTTGERTIQVFDGKALTAQIESARLMPDYTSDIMYPDEAGPLRNLALLPFHHIFGFVAVFLWFTFFQKTIVYPASMTPSHIRELAQDVRATHIFCVPLLWNGIAAHIRFLARQSHGPQAFALRRIIKTAAVEDIPSYCEAQRKLPRFLLRQVQKQIFGDSVRFLISGGSYISGETLRLINALGYPLYNGYGLTEAGITSVELSSALPLRVAGGIGIPLSNVEYREEDGTLRIRTPQLACGQMQDGEFVPTNYPDGWLDSGDLVQPQPGATDTATRYLMGGRKKDLIITAAGENIAPDIIEARLGGMEGLKRYCLLGLADHNQEETVSLLLEPENELDAALWQSLRQQIMAVNSQLPDYMQIRRVLLARQPLYITNTLKLRRTALKQDIESRIFPTLELKLSEDTSHLLYAVPQRLLDAVREQFAGALSRGPEEITDSQHFMLDLDGDSLSYADLIAGLEQRFGIRVPAEAYGDCQTVAAFGQLLLKMGARP